jgi:hypothetical protein
VCVFLHLDGDQVWAYLVQSDNDAECVAILSNISSAVCKALKDKVKDHLDDGRHIQYDETNRERLAHGVCYVEEQI